MLFFYSIFLSLLIIIMKQIFSQISDTEPTDLESGLYLLQAIKEELHLRPSRTSLDFLMSTCASARDPHHAQLIWEEYQKAKLCFNVLTYLRFITSFITWFFKLIIYLLWIILFQEFDFLNPKILYAVASIFIISWISSTWLKIIVITALRINMLRQCHVLHLLQPVAVWISIYSPKNLKEQPKIRILSHHTHTTHTPLFY